MISLKIMLAKLSSYPFFSSFLRPYIFSFLSFLFLLSPSFYLQAAIIESKNHIAYYGETFYRKLDEKSQITKEKVIEELHHVLNAYHISYDGHYDHITNFCDSQNEEGCYTHNSYSYPMARKMVMSVLYLKHNPTSGHHIRDVYCEKNLGEEDFPAEAGPSPIGPPDHNILNVEHTWPQSRFNRSSAHSKMRQKTDLHHLFPTSTKVNSIRANLPFGDVQIPINKNGLCPAVKLGKIDPNQDEIYFEPPANRKGNIARALFYFAVKYKMPIAADEERFLRRWHQEDPVDKEEKEIHDQIFQLQKTRNPFVDIPELVNQVDNF